MFPIAIGHLSCGFSPSCSPLKWSCYRSHENTRTLAFLVWRSHVPLTFPSHQTVQNGLLDVDVSVNSRQGRGNTNAFLGPEHTESWNSSAWKRPLKISWSSLSWEREPKWDDLVPNSILKTSSHEDSTTSLGRLFLCRPSLRGLNHSCSLPGASVCLYLSLLLPVGQGHGGSLSCLSTRTKVSIPQQAQRGSSGWQRRGEPELWSLAKAPPCVESLNCDQLQKHLPALPSWWVLGLFGGLGADAECSHTELSRREWAAPTGGARHLHAGTVSQAAAAWVTRGWECCCGVCSAGKAPSLPFCCARSARSIE